MTAIAIFVKTPGLSAVKTRLAAGIGAEAATEFHRLGAACAGAAAAACGASYWAVAERDGLCRWSDRPALWQGEGGLGSRMSRIYEDLLAHHGAVLLIGADSPQVTPEQLRGAATSLGPATPFVVGHARDGGFWLFGGCTPLPTTVWESVAYSTPNTCRDFLAALAPHGATIRASDLFDVDLPADLPDLLSALRALPAPNAAQARLAEWLAALPACRGL
jgi:glycosyltransferase A (GT-A) superfamily protein (DUF2064 family)